MYGNYGKPKQNLAPVQVGEEADVKIESVGEKGDGVAKVKGFVIFVPNTNTGDEVRVKITKVFKNLGFGEVVGQAQAPVESSESENTQEVPQVDHVEETHEDSEDFGSELLDEEEKEGFNTDSIEKEDATEDSSSDADSSEEVAEEKKED